MANEPWKDIPGYEGHYQINQVGDVKSLKYAPYFGRILKQRLSRSGYPVVELSLGRKNQKIIQIHRLVAITFIPNPKGKPCVNHKDGNRTNNHVDNLEWVTYSENNFHKFHTLGHKNHFWGNSLHKGKTGIRSKNAKKITRINGDIVEVYYGKREASVATGYSQMRIRELIRDKKRDRYGFLWSHEEVKIGAR